MQKKIERKYLIARESTTLTIKKQLELIGKGVIGQTGKKILKKAVNII